MSDADSDEQKNVEVCVRIRPLQVQPPTRTYFHSEATKKSGGGARRSQLRPATRSRLPSRIGGGSKPNSFDRKTPKETDGSSSNKAPEDTTTYAWQCSGQNTVSQTKFLVQGRTHSYTLDKVYGPSTTTVDLYHQSIRPLVHSAVDGYHTTVLAYGQTSTGKTHTMTGTVDQPGIIPLAVRECFDYLQRQQCSREYLLRVSTLEVYKEHIKDLLASSPTAPPVRLFDSADGLVIKGLHEEVVTTPEEVFVQLRLAEERRSVGATHMNQHSSRSHVLVRLWMESRVLGTQGKKGVRVSSLSLVDLAGSESVKLTGSSARRDEGHYINQSLMTLGQVVYALAEAQEKKNQRKIAHVPFRDSKLTRLLQPSLSGSAKVVLLCCISPLLNHLEESHNTFKFASRAKKIPQKAIQQETVPDDKTLLQGYREEIEDLKQQLLSAREEQSRYRALAAERKASSPSSDGGSVAVSDGEVHELTEAIATMEKLILKSSPGKRFSPSRPEDLLDTLMPLLDDNEEEENLMRLATPRSGDSSASSNGVLTPSRPSTPDEDLQHGLSHVQGLLDSVLKRRRQRNGDDNAVTQEEVRNLRKQLEEQQMATSLRQADSSFLQKQLEEKNKLLEEVGKVLEAVEERQSRLEEENASLRKELALIKQHQKLQEPTRAVL